MGRTTPTYRQFLESFEADWQPYRRSLRARYQADFDGLFAKANYFADAAGYQNAADPDVAVLLSVLLAQEVELRRLRAAVEAEVAPLPADPAAADPAAADPANAADSSSKESGSASASSTR